MYPLVGDISEELSRNGMEWLELNEQTSSYPNAMIALVLSYLLQFYLVTMWKVQGLICTLIVIGIM